MTGTKQRVLALVLMCSGSIVLSGVLLLYAIFQFASEALTSSLLGASAVNAMLSIGGVLGVGLIVVGIPLGIAIFVKSNKTLAREL